MRRVQPDEYRLFPVSVFTDPLSGSVYTETCHQGRAVPGEGVMHPMFVELFMETDADELTYEEDKRRRSRRAKRAQSRTLTNAAVPVTRARQAGSRP